ncbi:MAG: hypothetical protein V5B38_16275 [Candidatus Accumulibacter propinquus]
MFTSAVTSDDDRDRGRPSAWSSTVDRLASDYDGDGQFPRLFVLCAGNTQDAQSLERLPRQPGLTRNPRPRSGLERADGWRVHREGHHHRA